MRTDEQLRISGDLDSHSLRLFGPPLNLDTSPEIERLQIGRWRRMSAAEKAAIVTLGPDLARKAYPEIATADLR